MLCDSFCDNEIIDSVTPINTTLTAKYKRSFAYITIKDRLPVILTQVIDHLARDKEKIIKEFGEESREELKTVTGEFSKLKNELQTNKPFIKLTSDSPDVNKWNTFLDEQAEKEGKVLKWYSTVWIYAECYMYRRFHQIFEQSNTLKEFDPFRHLKEAALLNSLDAVVILGKHMLSKLKNSNMSEDTTKQEFLRLAKLSLWGNRCDLSFTAGKEKSQVDDPLVAVETLEEFLIVDEAERAWVALLQEKENKPTVDIILDNAGYELYTDMCIADFLCTFSLASKVRFYVKAMPWFVSDTTPHDFQWTIETLANSEELSSSLPELADRWKAYLDSGTWSIEVSNFWTLPYEYCAMKRIDPDLYAKLSVAALVVFKGDLNYRKLAGEVNWKPTESFTTALQGFHPTKLLALRTVKADLVCGLKPGQAEAAANRNVNWTVSGEFGLIQFDG